MCSRWVQHLSLALQRRGERRWIDVLHRLADSMVADKYRCLSVLRNTDVIIGAKRKLVEPSRGAGIALSVRHHHGV